MEAAAARRRRSLPPLPSSLGDSTLRQYTLHGLAAAVGARSGAAGLLAQPSAPAARAAGPGGEQLSWAARHPARHQDEHGKEDGSESGHD